MVGVVVVVVDVIVVGIVIVVVDVIVVGVVIVVVVVLACKLFCSRFLQNTTSQCN